VKPLITLRLLEIDFTEKLRMPSSSWPNKSHSLQQDYNDVGKILEDFYSAAVKRDFATLRSYLTDDLIFVECLPARQRHEVAVHTKRS
jgi:hypothetical protein